MKGLLFILLSIGMKTWHERQKEKVFPMQIFRYIESEERKMRINVRARTID